MRKRKKIFRKLVSTLFLNLFSVNFLADGLQLDPNSKYNTSLDKSQNGVPIVNIATPNNSGVSINDFLEYNVGNEGQILNNADNLGRSHLGGIINANPNLGPHQAANLILLQVNGSNRSQIEGYIEALSRQRVDVILSNENGIYLNNAGTINIRNFTPTTGKINLQDGSVVGIDVQKGRVIIGPNGFDATNTDYVNVIAKALELQGNLVGNKLDLTLGENTVDKNGNVTSKNGVNSVAIDASNLGSMYAGQIKIISTDKGAGVNSKGLIYSQNTKLEITADGKITVAKIKGNGIEVKGSDFEQTELSSSDKDINITANTIKLGGNLTQTNENINLIGKVSNETEIYAGGSLNVSDEFFNSGNVNVKGNIITGNFKNDKASVNAGEDFYVKNLENTGIIQVFKTTNISGGLDNSGFLISNNKITVQNIKNTGNILTNDNLEGKNTISSGEITSKNLKINNLQNDGTIATNENISAKNIVNTGNITSVGTIESDNLKTSGSVKSNGKITVNGKLENDGIVETGKKIKVASDIKNTDKIATNDNLEGKNTENTGNIYTKNLTINNLQNSGKIETSENLKSDDIINKGDVIVIGEISSRNIDNSGKLLTNGNISAKNIKNINKLASGSNITAGKVENVGIFATNGDLTTKDSVINSGNLTAKEINTVGSEFTNLGKISADNIKAKVTNTRNDGFIYSGNDIDLITNSFTNTKEISAINDVNIANSIVLNNGKIASNNKVLLDNSSITNTADILSGQISMKNASKFDNTGTVKGNDVVLTINQNLNLVGNLHGQQKLEISGNDIINNGNTTGTGLIKITSNNFTNNKELSSDTVLIEAKGGIENNDIITGNNAIISAKNIINNDLIATDNYLELNIQGKVQNNKGKAIYGGQSLVVRANEIMNDQAEILGGNMDLNAAKITNNIGTIQSTGDILITSSDFQNIGKVSNLNHYEKYYLTWDGIRLSEGDVKNYWIYHKGNDWDRRSNGSRGRSARNEQRRWLETFMRDDKNNPKVNSLLLNKYADEAKGALNRGYQKLQSEDAKHQEVALAGKLESKATTEYGKVIASGNITINSSDIKNRDSIISGGGLVNINATNLENSVTVGNPVQLQKGNETLELEIKRYRKKKLPRVKMVAYFNRNLVNGDIAYESGQPSVIEGRTVIVNASNIKKSAIKEADGQILENGGVVGRQLLSTTSIGVNKGTNSANGVVQFSKSGLVDKLNSSFNGNSQINANFDGKTHLIGNNSTVKNIINTGTITINPILSSAMFTTNMNPTSKYLMETRSKYISLGQYFGSDYFVTRVGYEPIWDRVRRLGDAYYENQLLTRTLAEKLGTSFINGKSNQELVQAMMDNAGNESTRLGLTVGQELTQDQINNLNEDIVWYVTKEVNGIEVLTPQVYLSSKTREKIGDDTRNRIGGIDGTYVKTNDLINNGMKIGNGGVTYVEANTVKNETTNNLLSEITGGRTIVNSVGNIENIGGLIQGRELVSVVSENGDVLNRTTTKETGYNNGELDRIRFTSIDSVAGILSEGTTHIAGNNYTSIGAITQGKDVSINVKNNIRIDALKLEGEQKYGSESDNYSAYGFVNNVGSELSAQNLQVTGNTLNINGSSVLAGTGVLDVKNINVISKINSEDNETRTKSEKFVGGKSTFEKSHEEYNSAGTLYIENQGIISGALNSVGSNVILGENSYVGGKVTTDSQQFHNSYYYKEKQSGVTGGINRESVSVGYSRSSNTYNAKSTINAKSNLQLGDGTTLNNGVEIIATNFSYGNISINNGDVKYGARIDTQDVRTTSKSSNFSLSAGVNSPLLDRINQAQEAVNQAKSGDKVGGAMTAVNTVTGVVSGMRNNITTKNGLRPATMEDIKSGYFKTNNDFYLSGNVNIGVSRSKSENNAHTESAAVTTMTPLNENSSITYNNVKNITYQGTQANGGTFIYNNVENITKEAVELNNRYSSNFSSTGANFNVSTGANLNPKPNGLSGSVSVSRGNQNTNETIYQNGNFQNVNEVHNNTGTMILNGFNQEGGKVTGNINHVEVISKQNTSTTTGSRTGVNVGVSSTGVPNSINVNYSNTNGNRAFVDNQSSFIVGDGSNLTIGKLENTAGIIGKEGNSTFKINEYVGKDLQNTDTMTTTGGSVGVSIGSVYVRIKIGELE